MTNTFLALPLGFWQGMVRYLNVQKSSTLGLLIPGYTGALVLLFFHLEGGPGESVFLGR